MDAVVKSPRDWGMLVGGEWLEAAGGERIEVITPIDRTQVIATVPRAREADADRAVEAARTAFPAWAEQPFQQRQLALLQVADRLAEQVEELAELTAIDTGNAIRTQARPEASMLVEAFRFFAGLAGEVKGVTLPTPTDQLARLLREETTSAPPTPRPG